MAIFDKSSRIMPRPRDEPESLRARRRQLAQQERLLAERMSRLNQELLEGGKGASSPPKAVEPPVWRLEDEAGAEASSAPRRNLARERRRDKILFFLFVGVLLIASCFFFWLYQTHLRAE
jgi:hypothetical protein